MALLGQRVVLSVLQHACALVALVCLGFHGWHVVHGALAGASVEHMWPRAAGGFASVWCFWPSMGGPVAHMAGGLRSVGVVWVARCLFM